MHCQQFIKRFVNQYSGGLLFMYKRQHKKREVKKHEKTKNREVKKGNCGEK